jgi:pyridinium-3,5-biscarboxylic acid mononucleotide sulfurtransferase
MARIEVDPEMLEHLAADREAVVSKLRELGYGHITLDLIGYRSGSLDERLPQ